jgi:hypothetical protein
MTTKQTAEPFYCGNCGQPYLPSLKECPHEGCHATNPRVMRTFRPKAKASSRKNSNHQFAGTLASIPVVPETLPLYGTRVSVADRARIKKIADCLWMLSPADVSETQAKRLAVSWAQEVIARYRADVSAKN